jgi:septum formation protein
MPRLVLASASPRREELLGRLGLPFDIIVPDVPEDALPGESPEGHVARLAADKAAAVRRRAPQAVILAADTVVVLGGEILGKPAGPSEARLMLGRLSGRTHRVLTGWVLSAPGGAVTPGVEESRVTMRPLPPADIEAYLTIGEYADKAGAYAVQGEGGRLVEAVDGSWTNVVGLPVPPVRAALLRLGYEPLDPGLS